MTRTSDVFMAGIEEVGKSWGWFLVIGLLLIVLGFVCVGTSQATTTISILVFGWVLAISAVVWFVGTFQARSWGGVFLYLLNAIIRGVTAYLLLRHPDAGAAGITLLLASLFIVGGIYRTAAASVIQFPRWGWTAFAGVISVVLGIMLLVYWPAASTFFIGMAVGIDLIFDGTALAGFAGALHSLYKVGTYRTA